MGYRSKSGRCDMAAYRGKAKGTLTCIRCGRTYKRKLSQVICYRCIGEYRLQSVHTGWRWLPDPPGWEQHLDRLAQRAAARLPLFPSD